MLHNSSESVHLQHIVLVGAALLSSSLFIVNRLKDYADGKKTNGMPGSRGNIPFVDSTIAFALNPRIFLRDGFARYGPVFRTRLMGMDTVCLSGAHAARLVYNNDELFAVRMFDPLMRLLDGFMLIQNGSEHKKNRALIVRALSESQLCQNLRGIAEVFNVEVNKWADRPSGVEVYKAIKTAILKVMMKVLFGSSNIPEHDLDRLVAEFELYGKGFLALPIDLPFTTQGRAFVARKRILEQLVDIVDSRRRDCAETGAIATGRPQDLLQTMIDSPDPETGELADTTRIASNCLVMLLAALDTTSSTVASVVKLLGEHDQVREKVAEECARVWEGCERIDLMSDEAIGDGLARLAYFDCVLQETLRVRAPLMSTFRVTTADVQVPGTDYVIPKGWMVSMSHDASFLSDAVAFPDPEKFMPERFLPGGVSHMSANYKGAHFPFSKGIHQCPGNKFALAEAKIIISILVSRSQWPQLMEKCGEYQCQNPALEEAGGMLIKFFH